MPDGGLLAGRVAVLAGVGGGLGRAVALLFAKEGASLLLAARSDATARGVAEDVADLGAPVATRRVDLRSADDCEAMAAAADERFGRLDILVNIAYLSSDRTTLEEADRDLANWRPQFEMNVFATLQATKAVVPYMKSRGQGRIIMVNTVATKILHPKMASYAGSKAALEVMTKTLALELGEFGIRVNSVLPGYMWGPRMGEILRRRAAENGTTEEDELEAVTSRLALGYMPAVSEYAGTILFLASDLSLPITGESIRVDAGQQMF